MPPPDQRLAERPVKIMDHLKVLVRDIAVINECLSADIKELLHGAFCFNCKIIAIIYLCEYITLPSRKI